MRYVLGVEGGMTVTTAVIADETGCLLGVGQGGPVTNRLHESGHTARTQKALNEAVQSAVRTADLENARIACMCVGLPEETRHTDSLEAMCAPMALSGQVMFAPLARLALYSVTFGRPGVVVIAGTRALCYGLNAEGQEAQTGGWGYPAGDEGSGYWIALRALSACCRAYDGIDPATQILPLLLRHLECQDLLQLHKTILANRLSQDELAGIAELVSRAAAQGDKTARRILREAGKELALGAKSVLYRLSMQQDAVTIGTVGSVFRAGRAVLRTFREVVKQTAPEAHIVPGRVHPAVGAALLALEAIDVPIHDALLANVEAALPRLGAVKA